MSQPDNIEEVKSVLASIKAAPGLPSGLHSKLLKSGIGKSKNLLGGEK